MPSQCLRTVSIPCDRNVLERVCMRVSFVPLLFIDQLNRNLPLKVVVVSCHAISSTRYLHSLIPTHFHLIISPLLILRKADFAVPSTTGWMNVRSNMTSIAAVGHHTFAPVIYTQASLILPHTCPCTALCQPVGKRCSAGLQSRTGNIFRYSHDWKTFQSFVYIFYPIHSLRADMVCFLVRYCYYWCYALK